MIRRELFDRIGLFDEPFPCCEDYELWLRASVAHPFFLVDSSLVAKHGGRSDQVSVRFQTGMDRFRIRVLEKLLLPAHLTSEQFRIAREELIRKACSMGTVVSSMAVLKNASAVCPLPPSTPNFCCRLFIITSDFSV
ncbi:MAG: hypothetical protein WC256_07780 [Desulfurivibrionaceae bacterium]|jgi:GT2 family glycosyltransferase